MKYSLNGDWQVNVKLLTGLFGSYNATEDTVPSAVPTRTVVIVLGVLFNTTGDLYVTSI